MTEGEAGLAASHTSACVGWASPEIELPYQLAGLDPVEDHRVCERPIKWAHLHQDATNGSEWHWRSEPYRGCRSFDCPVSVRADDARWGNRWLTREVAVAAHRLGRRVIHVVISPPGPTGPMHSHIWVGEFRKLRTKAYRLLREAYPRAQLKGCLVPHPERCVDSEREGGHDGLHFHAAIVPCGEYDGRAVKRAHLRTGWVVKVKGPRNTRQLLAYELHHAGRWLSPTILPNALANSRYATEAITWFGDLPPAPECDSEGVWCQSCLAFVPGNEWQEVTWSREPVGDSSGTLGRAPEGTMISLTMRRLCSYG